MSYTKTQQLNVNALQFGMFSPDEVLKLSVAEVSNEIPYENGMPTFGGINDPRLGTINREFRCITCKGGMEECPGHFGHIVLNRRVYHIGYLTYLLKTLRCVCFNCSRLLLGKSEDDKLLKVQNNKVKFNHCYNTCNKLNFFRCDSEQGGCGYV